MAPTLFGLLCGFAAVVVFCHLVGVWPEYGQCYWAGYDPTPDQIFGEMAAKMWPTRWLWIGIIATHFGVRFARTSP